LDNVIDRVNIILPAEISGDTISRFEAEIEAAIKLKPSKVEIDCGGLGRVSSPHIGAIWYAHSKCNESEVRVYLSRASNSLLRVLESLDICDLVEIANVEPSDRNEDVDTERIQLQTRHLDMSFQPTISGIDAAIKELGAFMADVGVADSTAITLETVFYEIATNIRVHSTLKANEEVECLAEIDEGTVTLRFSDSGQEFDPTDMTSQFDPGEAIRLGQWHGFGLGMIGKLVDNIDYARSDNGFNVLTVSKKWSA